MSLKSLAESVISRNQQRNKGATGTEYVRNNTSVDCTEQLRFGATSSDEQEVVGWLERIGEPDPKVFRETLDKCRANPDALRFFLDYARSGTVH